MRNLKVKSGKKRIAISVLLLMTAGMSLAEEVKLPEDGAYSLLERQGVNEDRSPAPSKAIPLDSSDTGETSPYDLGYQKRIENGIQLNKWGLPWIKTA